jgi:hypothetical protein
MYPYMRQAQMLPATKSSGSSRELKEGGTKLPLNERGHSSLPLALLRPTGTNRKGPVLKV